MVNLTKYLHNRLARPSLLFCLVKFDVSVLNGFCAFSSKASFCPAWKFRRIAILKDSGGLAEKFKSLDHASCSERCSGIEYVGNEDRDDR